MITVPPTRRAQKEENNYAILYANEKLVFNFSDAHNCVYDPTKIELISGRPQKLLIQYKHCFSESLIQQKEKLYLTQPAFFGRHLLTRCEISQ